MTFFTILALFACIFSLISVLLSLYACILTKAMEPAVIFVVSGIVGTIVVALYLPMFALIQEMG